MRISVLGACLATVLATGSGCTTPEAADRAAMGAQAAPGGDYQRVSDLVPLPEFIPNLGTLYVQPATLPAGPFLAYDRQERLVSTIYMIPLETIQAQQPFEDLAVGSEQVVSVDMYYNAGHPGVEQPHYHVVLWHVPQEQAQLQ